MKKSRFLLIPLLLICGVLLLSLLLRWIASPNLEEIPTDSAQQSLQTQAGSPAYTRWHLPEGATLRLGKGHIRDIKFVPDGTQFVVATSIGIWLYDAHTGAEIARFNKEPRNTKTIAFSPDGKTLISGDSEGEVQLWDTSTVKLRSTFRGPREITNAVSVFSADRIKLANEQHGNIRLWEFNTKTTQPIVTDINSDSRFGYSVVMALSPNAMFFAAATREGDEIYPVWVWDANTGELLFTLKGHTRWIRTLAFSPDSKTLASGNERRTIRLWDTDTGTLRATLKVPAGSFHALAFSPNGKLLASGSGDGSVRLWDATAKKQYVPLLTLKGHKNRVSTLAFSPDGKTLLSGGYSGNILAWDTTTGSKRFTCSGHLGNALGLAFSETESTLTSVHYAQNWSGIQLMDWDINTGDQLSTNALNTKGGFGTISPDGKTVTTQESPKDTVELWDVNTKRRRSTLKEVPKEDWDAQFIFSPDSKTVASGGADNVVRLWDAAMQQSSGFRKFFGFVAARHPQLTIQGHPVHVRTLAFSPDGKMLAGGSNLGAIHLWDAHTSTKLFTLKEHNNRIHALAFSLDGKTLASGSQNGEISLWDTTNGTKGSANILKPRATVSALLFSPDGKILVSGNGSGILQLWDVHTGRLLSSDACHTNPIRALLLSPDGKTLASGSNDGTILLWDWETLQKADDR